MQPDRCLVRLANIARKEETTMTAPLPFTPDLSLKPGMTASVKIVTAQEEDTLMLPNAALRFTPPGAERHPSHPHVWQLDEEGQLEHVLVETVLTDGIHTAIHGDRLELGDPVLVDLTSEGRKAYEKQKRRGG